MRFGVHLGPLFLNSPPASLQRGLVAKRGLDKDGLTNAKFDESAWPAPTRDTQSPCGADLQLLIQESTEMTKAVLEAESEGAARRTAAAIPSPALAVPASLHASLMARLDRLGPAKEVAQIGAAIGR